VTRRIWLLSLIVLGACGGAQSGGSRDSAEHPLIGAAAPAFELPGASLAAVSGKVVIVDLWATWCKPCRQSFPFYQRLVDQHAGEVVVLALSIDDEPDEIESFARRSGARFAVAWDEGKAVARRYRPPSLPTSYLIDRRGIVRFVHVGFRPGDDRRIEAAVAELVNP
jgi:cytochrome c biogenesis protein CcmG, thiol:disulfide interchange protein DsbE